MPIEVGKSDLAVMSFHIVFGYTLGIFDRVLEDILGNVSRFHILVKLGNAFAHNKGGDSCVLETIAFALRHIEGGEVSSDFVSILHCTT